MRSYEFNLPAETISLLFQDVHRLRSEHSIECLNDDQLLSDSSEKANGITRDRSTGTLCCTIAIYGENGETEEYFSMRENSPALLASSLYRAVSTLIEPHENL